jgi:AcrR family transcriptional regulator
MAESDAALDGRRQRSLRSRERLLDAVEAAVREPDLVMSPEHIATRAGVSLSTLFRHFGDMEGLAAAMRERVGARLAPLLGDRDFAGDRATRVRALVERRNAAFEVAAPFQRAAVRQPVRTKGARAIQERMQGLLRDLLEAALGRDLPSPACDDTRTLVAARLSFETWEHLRTIQALEPSAIVRLLERGALALLNAAPR